MSDEYINNAERAYLMHYGVRGMKWGVRKDRVSGAGRAVGRASRRAARATGRVTGRLAKRGASAAGRGIKSYVTKKREEAKANRIVKAQRRAEAKQLQKKHRLAEKKMNKLRKKKTHQLSNDELRILNERLRLEAEYNRVSKDKSKIRKGYKFVKGAVDVGTTLNTAYKMSKSSPLVRDVASLLVSSKTNTGPKVSKVGPTTPLNLKTPIPTTFDLNYKS